MFKGQELLFHMAHFMILSSSGQLLCNICWISAKSTGWHGFIGMYESAGKMAALGVVIAVSTLDNGGETPGLVVSKDLSLAKGQVVLSIDIAHCSSLPRVG